MIASIAAIATVGALASQAAKKTPPASDKITAIQEDIRRRMKNPHRHPHSARP